MALLLASTLVMSRGAAPHSSETPADTRPSCPPAGTNASCAQVGGCGRWCSEVCSCEARCHDYKEGCCWDQHKCPPAPPPSPGPHPTYFPHHTTRPPAPGGPHGGPEQFHLALGPGGPATAIIDFATSKGWGGGAVCETSTQGNTGPFGTPVTASTRTYTAGEWQGLLHRAVLSGLTPGPCCSARLPCVVCGVGVRGGSLVFCPCSPRSRLLVSVLQGLGVAQGMPGIVPRASGPTGPGGAGGWDATGKCTGSC